MIQYLPFVTPMMYMELAPSSVPTTYSRFQTIKNEPWPGIPNL